MALPYHEQTFGPREGEVPLAEDPAAMAGDGHVVFIGKIRSPWRTREECPKNMAAARSTGQAARVEIDAPFRPGLEGLDRASHVVILSWLHHGPRNLIVQKPRHAAAASGVFALRSPARPNPVGLHIARLLSIDVATGVIEIDAIDVLDATPVIDLKPYLPSIDAFPGATRAEATRRSAGE
ncbi:MULTISPECIES: tRNA (N6-threonylcarbamoyladenosine(37)-N6)-methyltransferase TrmO [unclassified Mesorhizobium]|uniref:tRNA (N6-threonylcarbamoyladenosine(37)-N6)-methyltransferase TrmO n=1 Tax=unclassified Mesorhizobium TaxID=325217 RepID=UPI001FD4F86D|nr:MULTISPECIES: tRNA (N6-threonylcarbamoyladenosine(37)-N6)-methyltransferase TrmO [unclassified Mesorhizobium]